MLAAFTQFCAYLERVSGIVIGEDKRYLVESRILPIVRREKMTGLSQLLAAVQTNRLLRDEVVQAMTINETYFFRDKTPFEIISDKLFPRLHNALPPGESIKIWCAACSTGQEPYSLSMIAEERRALLQGRKVEILATDVSDPVIARARLGSYSSFEVQRGLSEERLGRHFIGNGTAWQIKPELKGRITFRSMNLLSDYSGVGPFDIVLCRNVLIYFNLVQKTEVIRRLCRCLRSGGYLMLGASESPMGSTLPIFADPDLKGCYSWVEPGPTVASNAARALRLN